MVVARHLIFGTVPNTRATMTLEVWICPLSRFAAPSKLTGKSFMGLLNSFIRKESWSVSSLSHFEASAHTPKLMRSLRKRRLIVVGRKMNDLLSLLRLEKPCAFHTICPLPRIFARKATRISKTFVEVALLMQMLNLRCLFFMTVINATSLFLSSLTCPWIPCFPLFFLHCILSIISLFPLLSLFIFASLFLIVWVSMLFSFYVPVSQDCKREFSGDRPPNISFRAWLSFLIFFSVIFSRKARGSHLFFCIKDARLHCFHYGMVSSHRMDIFYTLFCFVSFFILPFLSSHFSFFHLRSLSFPFFLRRFLFS